MDKKPWLSKTIVFNALVGVLAGLSAVLPALAPVKEWLGQNVVLFGMLWSGLNILLRFITNGKIILSDE